MDANLRFSELNAVLATLDPASVAASTVVTAYVPATNFHRLSAVLQTGVLGTAATVDAKLRQATDASGTGAKDITGKAITQIVKTSGDNVQAMIDLRTDELDATGGFAYVSLSVTVGAAASLLSAVLYGHGPRFAPASQFNQAAVVQLA
jgi:hypothetical protein